MNWQSTFEDKPKPKNTDSRKPLDAQEKQYMRILIFAFVLFTIVAAVSGFFVYQNYKKQFIKQTESEISAIAELKVNELVDWRKERFGDAEILRENPALAALAKRVFDDPSDIEARTQLQAWLTSYRTYSDYDRMRLMDIKGNIYISDPVGLGPVASEVSQLVPEVLKSGQVMMVDFYRSADQNIYLGMIIPIVDVSADGQIVGLIALSIDPQPYLYPFIQEWPVPSTSSETLIIRRDGDSALFLNPLRFQDDAALTMRLPLDQTQRPSVKAVLGVEGIVEGLDYRNEEVIADIRAVPNSPWFLVSKMDTAEVYAPLRERLWMTVFFFGALVMMAGAGLLQLWRQQRVRYYKEQVKTNEALRASEEKFRLAFDTSPDAVTITRLADGIYVSVNKGFELMSGYTREQIIGKSSLEVNIWKNPEDRRNMVEELKANGKIQNYEAVLVMQDAEIQSLVSASIIELNDVPHILSVTHDITQRKLAEEKLRESERRYRLISENSADVIWTLDLATRRFTYVSPSVFNLRGLTPEEVMAEPMQAAITPESHEQISENLPQRIARYLSGDLSARTHTTQVDQVHKDGFIIPTEVVTNLITNAEGKVTEVLGVTRDITGRKLTEEALKASELRFRALIEHGMDNISLIAPDGTLLWESPATTQMLGYAYDQFKGQNIFDLVHPQDIDRVQMQFAEILREQGKAAHDSFRLKRADGVWRWVEAIGTNLLHEPSVAAIVVNYRDITERRQTEKALQESEERFHKAFRSSPVGMAITAADGSYLDANEAFSKIVGFSHEELTSQTSLELNISAPELLYEYVQVMQKQGYILNQEILLRHKSGNMRTVLISMELIELNGMSYALSTVNDITERKLAEASIRESEANLSTLIENTDGSIWAVDKQYGLIVGNKEFHRNVSAVLGRHLETGESVLLPQFPPQVAAEWQEYYDRALRGERFTNETQTRFREPPLYLEYRFSPIREETGEIRGVTIYGRDITERKRSEELLRKNETRLRQALTAAKAGIWEWDLQTNQNIWSEELWSVYGLEAYSVEPCYDTWLATIHPEDRENTAQSVLNAVNNETELNVEWRVVDKDGTQRWLMSRGQPLRNPDGQAVRFIGTVLDITERKQTEHALQMRTEDFALINSMNEAANRGETINGLVKLFTQKIEEMVPAYYGSSIYLFDPSQKYLEIQGFDLSQSVINKIEKLIGRPIPKLEIPVREGSYFQKLLNTEQGVITSDSIALQEWIAEFTDTTFLPALVRSGLKKFVPQIFNLLKVSSVITIPLISSGKAIGLLDVSSSILLTEDDLKRVRNISNQMTAVILRKQSEQLLLESENKYRTLVQNMQVGMVVHKPDTSILLSNPMASTLLGLTQDQMLGKTAIDPAWCFIREDGSRMPLDEYPVNQALSSNEPISNLVIGILRPDKEKPCWAQCDAYQVRETDGTLQQIVVTFFDITERKNADEALQKNHVMLAKLTAQVPGVVYQYRLYPDGRSAFPFASPGMNDIYEVTPDEVREDATVVFGRLHPADYDRVSSDIFKSADTLSPFHCEFRVLLPRQGLRWRLSDAIPERTEDGGTLWYGIISDITERKQTEEILRKSEDRFRSLFENAPIGVMLVDPTGNVLEVNPSALQTLGSPSVEATRQINMLSFPPLINAGITADFQKCVQTAQLLSSERPYTTKWGKSINLNLRFAPLVDTEGKLQLLQILIEDVTARKEAERALLESQSRFRALFEDSPIAIWEEDFSQVKKHIDSLKQDGVADFRAYFASHPDEIVKCVMMFNILNVNSAALRMYRAPNKEELIQNTLPVLSAGEWEHSHEDLIAIAEGRTSNGWDGGDETMAGEPIQITMSWSVVPGYEHDYSKVVVTTVDITERKRNEELIRQYTDELELRVEERTLELIRASRAKDEFLANMSHELRTPLNGILGFSETLLEGIRGPMNERQVQAVELIQSSGQHLLGLINDILDVSKIESGKFELQLETLVVNDICHSSLNFIKQMAIKKSISVEYSSNPASATLIADPKRLKQILVNLLNNAVKFTPEMGKVNLEVRADAEAGLMRFSITDTGIGITPENQQKLFKPFIQVDSSLSRQYDGTGLGLSLVKKLVEMHGGNVELTSEIGNGSCFAFTLPWKPTAEKLEEQPLPSAEKNAGNTAARSIDTHNKKILLADDNQANVTMVKDYLESRGYEIHIAMNGREAIEKAFEFLPDIILMDIQMPQINGIDATHRLRADPRFAAVPIIALTAFAMSGDRERCLEAGMNEYMSKPVKLKELSKMIERFLENPVE